MQGKARGRWVSRCLEGMQVSSAAAAKVLQRHGCSGATDVTGFGLLGHVVEMARASQVGDASTVVLLGTQLVSHWSLA
jgi:selenide,water dikinase